MINSIVKIIFFFFFSFFFLLFFFFTFTKRRYSFVNPRFSRVSLFGICCSMQFRLIKLIFLFHFPYFPIYVGKKLRLMTDIHELKQESIKNIKKLQLFNLSKSSLCNYIIIIIIIIIIRFTIYALFFRPRNFNSNVSRQHCYSWNYIFSLSFFLIFGIKFWAKFCKSIVSQKSKHFAIRSIKKKF